jgi:hypothetical protein
MVVSDELHPSLDTRHQGVDTMMRSNIIEKEYWYLPEDDIVDFDS